MTTMDEYMRDILKDFPKFEFGQDNDGQIVIYTGMTITAGGEVAEMDDEELGRCDVCEVPYWVYDNQDHCTIEGKCWDHCSDKNHRALTEMVL